MWVGVFSQKFYYGVSGYRNLEYGKLQSHVTFWSTCTVIRFQLQINESQMKFIVSRKALCIIM